MKNQEHEDFEVILVDQNEDDLVVPIIQEFEESFAVKRIASAPGLSRARNVGLEHVTGDIIAFPDDDCVYPAELLATVEAYLAKRPEFAGVTGRSVSQSGHPSAGRFDSIAGPVTKANVWRRCVSITVFVRSSVASKYRFDETLGAGGRWESGEETDYLLKVMGGGNKIFYSPKIAVVHPEPEVAFDSKAIERAWTYGRGMGRVLRKHSYSPPHVLSALLRPLVGAIMSLSIGNRGEAYYRFQVFRGRLAGWLARGSGEEPESGQAEAIVD